MNKILLASKYQVVLRNNSNLLMNWGFQLFMATSGAEALKLHAEHHFDLIICDFELEDMGGCTLCSLVRKEKQSQYVPIIITCHNLPGSIKRARLNNASAILLKPIDPIQFLETIGKFVDLNLVRSKRVMLKVYVTSKKQNLEFHCVSHDISNTGMLLESEQQLALGSRITCQFTLPGACRIEAEGEVTRCTKGAEFTNLYGLRFIALPLPCRRAIDCYVTATDYPAAAIPPKEQSTTSLIK